MRDFPCHPQKSLPSRCLAAWAPPGAAAGWWQWQPRLPELGEHHPRPTARPRECALRGKGHRDVPAADKGCPNSPVSVALGGEASGGSNPAPQVSPNLGHPACSAPDSRWTGSVSRSARSRGDGLTPPFLPRRCRLPTSFIPLFERLVPLPIKNLPFFGLCSSLSSSCPASCSASLGQGKGLSSMEILPCPGTSRMGPSCLLPGAVSLSLWAQLRAGVALGHWWQA